MKNYVTAPHLTLNVIDRTNKIAYARGGAGEGVQGTIQRPVWLGSIGPVKFEYAWKIIEFRL